MYAMNAVEIQTLINRIRSIKEKESTEFSKKNSERKDFIQGMIEQLDRMHKNFKRPISQIYEIRKAFKECDYPAQDDSFLEKYDPPMGEMQNRVGFCFFNCDVIFYGSVYVAEDTEFKISFKPFFGYNRAKLWEIAEAQNKDCRSFLDLSKALKCVKEKELCNVGIGNDCASEEMWEIVQTIARHLTEFENGFEEFYNRYMTYVKSFDTKKEEPKKEDEENTVTEKKEVNPWDMPFDSPEYKEWLEHRRKIDNEYREFCRRRR